MHVTTRVISVLAALMCATACSPERGGAAHSPGPLTQDTARLTLENVVTGVAKNGVTDFCSRNVRSTGTCAILIKDALEWCLLPGDKPQVTRTAFIPPKGESEGGWLFELRGQTRDGQQYISEFFVIRQGNEPPQAAFGVYWTGLGFDGSPFGPNNTKVPQNACPGAGSSRS